MSATEALSQEHAHDHDGHHDHPEWLAHHFDDAEQQFDSGKLGMWLFLVTEVLFFSGMFCGYAYLRSRDPEVFAFASEFLNTKLGAINTGVLLFSSLTMAWAVRASQLSQHRLLVGLLGATLGCASMFLGVKAVEYSHKWQIGLLPGEMYRYQFVAESFDETNYLFYLMVIPFAITAGLLVWYLVAMAGKKAFQAEVAGPLFVAGLCFFGGIGLGQVLESGGHHGEGHEQHAAHVDDHEHSGEHGGDGRDAGGGDHVDHDHDEADHSHEDHGEDQDSGVAAESDASGEMLVAAVTSEYGFTPAQSYASEVAESEVSVPRIEVNQPGKAGLFFGIYYCMTGVHAIHILAGMLVIAWLIVKAARKEFHSQYFGPVDNVGLYWHLVDFIWIYLFPLLYLIG